MMKRTIILRVAGLFICALLLLSCQVDSDSAESSAVPPVQSKTDNLVRPHGVLHNLGELFEKGLPLVAKSLRNSIWRTDRNNAERRLAYASESDGDILVGVNWPFSNADDLLFREGMVLAQREINAAGGILGRKLVMDFRDNKGDLKRGRKIAKAFARNEKMTAVIGHAYSDIATEASVIYENASLLLLTPRAQLNTLSQHGMNLFFRTSPSNAYLGEQAAEFTARLNFHRPIVIMASSEYSKELANVYQTNLSKRGINIVYTFYYFPWNSDYRSILSQMEHMNYDIVFVAMDGEEIVDFVVKARSLGNSVPVMVMNVSSDDFIQQLGDASDNTLNVVFYNPTVESKRVRDFQSAFHAKHKVPPDVWAAKGYDSVHLLADMIEKTNSINPHEIAVNLHFLEGWEGVSGTYTFQNSGDVIVEPCFLETIQDGEVSFRDMAEFKQIPLRERLEQLFENDIEAARVEITEGNGIVSLALSETFLFGDQLTSLAFDGRQALGAIARLSGDFKSQSLHVQGQLSYTTVILEEGIGSLIDRELEEIRTMTVGSYLIGQGVSSKRIFIQGKAVNDHLRSGKRPEQKVITGNRIEVLFVEDALLEDASR